MDCIVGRLVSSMDRIVYCTYHDDSPLLGLSEWLLSSGTSRDVYGD